VPRDQLAAVLFVEDVDVLAAVDLADSLQLGPVQTPEHHLGPHRLTLARATGSR
jgi:hypothetical protein